MLFPSPSEWKMVKDNPNHIPDNMTAEFQISRKIKRDGTLLYYR